jgi:endonuclease/exonuclease/phosphatase family metal-dependent hydrolase
VRIATFNILGGRSPADRQVDVDRFAAAIRGLDADLLALQEVDRDQPRSDGTDLTAVAAEAMGATDHRFVAALAGLPGDWRAATGEEPPGLPAYGISLLSRYDVRSWRVVRLAPAPVRALRDEPRVAIVAEVVTPAGPLDVAATHLTFVRPWNAVQLRRLVAQLAPERPTVLLGDLNLGPRWAHRLTGMTPLARGATFPAQSPRRQLDHVLGSGLDAPAGGRGIELALSDHRALVVDL